MNEPIQPTVPDAAPDEPFEVPIHAEKPRPEIPAGQHTPGPWEAYDPCYGVCGYACTPDGCHENHPVGERRVGGPEGVDGDDIELMRVEDARLIAAAPEMMEACKAIVALREAHRALLDTLEADHPKLFKAIDQAESAIAKATGQGVGA